MSKLGYAAIGVVSFMLAGCSAGGGSNIFAARGVQQQAQQNDREAIRQRLIPEEGQLPANRLRDVIAAISMFDKEFQMENPTRQTLGRHLVDRNLTDLRRIEANVLAIEQKRRDAGN